MIRLSTPAWRFAAALVAFVVAGPALAESPNAESPNANPPPPAVVAKPPTAAASAPGAGEPAPLRAFNEVARGATRDEGIFSVWRKDERVWLEIPRDQLGKRFLFTANISRSVGERGLYASQMAMVHLVEWRLVGRQLQLMAVNTKFRADADQGSRRAIEEAFSPSLLSSTTVASADHAQRKSFLVDAGFLLSDIPSYGTRLEIAYRMPFGLDRANSSFERTRSESSITALTARLHFAAPRIPAPSPVPSPMQPSLPGATPDPRSLFVDVVYSFLALPEQPMAARTADPRIGHFSESFTDLGGDLKANPRTHYIKRWRLEKKDPQAALSEPVKPITFWLDKNIPAKYRPAIEAGILEWNKAFERIGFRNAVVAKQQPDDAKWDNMDAGHASVRWFVGADVGFAIGPSHADPRTGEILDADIGMSDVFARFSRRQYVEDVGKTSEQRLAEFSARWRLPGQPDASYFCEDPWLAAADTQFALDLLEARSEMANDSPEAEAFVMSAIRGTMMHEVGHVLGLKHNFKASTGVTPAQLQDVAFTEANGTTNSVMEYAPVNLALKGERQGSFHRQALGPYDYWAIEYAYRPFEPGQDKEGLARIAARSTERELAFADDADAGGVGGNEGIDPMANRFDLGDDPLAYYRKRMKLSQELWARVQDRKPQAGEDPLRQRRSIMLSFGPLATVADLAAKFVGGMNAVRDLPGSTARPAFQPVAPARQREALQFLAGNVFSADSFRFRPELLSQMTVDYNEWDRGGPADITSAVGRVQQAALDRLMSPGTAMRMLDLPAYVPESQRKGLISLNEVYETLQGTIWSELATGAEIDRVRRNLQREHVRRLQGLLTRGSGGLPPDALSLLRYNATKLHDQMRVAVTRAGARSVETRAHLAECLGVLNEALQAKMQRS